MNSRNPEQRSDCVLAGAMRATVRIPGSFQCAGPRNAFPGDSAVAVTAALETPDACAAVWIRWNGRSGYQVRVCAAEVQVIVDRPEARTILRRMPLGQPLTLGQGVNLVIETIGSSVRISLDGTPVGGTRLTEGDLPSGQVVLGVSVDAQGEPPPYSVAFADVEIRSLPR